MLLHFDVHLRLGSKGDFVGHPGNPAALLVSGLGQVERAMRLNHSVVWSISASWPFNQSNTSSTPLNLWILSKMLSVTTHSKKHDCSATCFDMRGGTDG